MGIIYGKTYNSSPDEDDIIWTASFQKKGRYGYTSKVHKAKRFCRGVIDRERERAIVRTFPGQKFTKHLCDLELKKVAITRKIIKEFNEHRYGMKIKILGVSEALIDSKDDEWCLIEDRCQKPFRYFLDRYGKSETKAEFQILQTLVHFSYQYTLGKMIITNLKGCMDSKSFTLSIPTIHSISGSYGLKDEGLSGIEKCFDHHTCNRVCKEFLKHESQTEMKSRPRTPSAPYDPELLEDEILKNSEGLMESDTDIKPPALYILPPYSPIDPNPLCSMVSPYHSPIDFGYTFSSAELKLYGIEDNVFNRNDDVFS